LARQRLEHFTTFTYPKYLVEPAHRLIAATLDRVVNGDLKRLMIFAPPQSGKSELASVRLPALWLGRRPEDPVMLASYAASLAEDKSRQVREIVESAEYARLFPGVSTRRDSRAKNLWHLPGQRGSMRAVGIDGGGTGHGALLGLIDDPVKNWEQAQSQVYLDHAWEWWRTTFRPRIWEHGAIVLIQTRWSKQDLAGRILAEQGDEWEVLRLPALAEDQDERAINNKRLGLPLDLSDPLGREAGEPLCPRRFSRAALLALKRDVGSVAWAAEYQGIPSEAEGAHFKRAWFTHRFHTSAAGDVYYLWPNGKPNGRFHLARDCAIIVTVDPAASEKKTADRTGIGVFAVTPTGEILILDMIRERLGIEGIVPRLAGVCRQWQPIWVGMEADGFQVGVAREADRHPDIPTVLEMKSQGKGKLVRAHASVIRAEKGQIYLPEDAEWLESYTDEMVSFTGNEDPHDEAVDVTAYAVNGIDRFGTGGFDDDEDPTFTVGGFGR
jgi:predicted phage terminase large subunit-like protein